MNSTLTIAPNFLTGGIPRAARPNVRANSGWMTLALGFAEIIKVQPTADWQKLLGANVSRLKSLKPGWDGPGSLPVNQKLLGDAVDMVRSALAGLSQAAVPYLVPAGDGSLQIEWHERHAELELELLSDGQRSIFFRDHLTGAELAADGPEASNLFHHWARWVASQPDDVCYVSRPRDVANFEVAA